MSHHAVERAVDYPDGYRVRETDDGFQVFKAGSYLATVENQGIAQALIDRLRAEEKVSHNPGKPFRVGERVQLHAATDEWMQGDRYGTVVGYGRPAQYIDTTTKERGTVRPIRVRLDKSGRTRRFHPDNLFSTGEYDSDDTGVNPPDDEYEVQGRYEGGWECVNTETTRADANRSLREYQENERGTAFRVRRVKATPDSNPPSKATRKRFGFFKAHAGGVVGESAKGALALSRAEDWASAEGVTFAWEPETDVDDSWMSPEERKRPHEVYSAVARHPDGRIASLGNIFDPDSAYQRVVNAELAMELMSE